MASPRLPFAACASGVFFDQLRDLGHEAVRVEVDGLHAAAADRHLAPLAGLGANLTQRERAHRETMAHLTSMPTAAPVAVVMNSLRLRICASVAEGRSGFSLKNQRVSLSESDVPAPMYEMSS